MFKNLKYSSRIIGICILVLFAFYMFIVFICFSASDLYTIIFYENISVIIEISILILLMIYVFSLLFNKGNELLLLAGISKAKIYFSAMIPILTFLLIFTIYVVLRKYISLEKVSLTLYNGNFLPQFYNYILINGISIFMFTISFSLFLFYKSNILKNSSKYVKIIVVEALLILIGLVIFTFIAFMLVGVENTDFNDVFKIIILIIIYIISFIMLILDVFIYKTIELK